MVNVDGVPLHPDRDGVSVIVPEIGALPLLVAVNAGRFPVPDAPSPIEVLELVHDTLAVDGVGERTVAGTEFPAHQVCATLLTLGVGLIVIVYVFDVPVQPPLVGVTVMVAVTGVLPLFTAVNAGTVPVPLAARPMEGLLFVQLKTAPDGVPVKAVAGTLAPAQKVWLEMVLTVGEAPTVTVAVAVELQLPVVPVTV